MDNPAIIFPGQGAQTVGMGRSLIEAMPSCADRFTEASDILGFDLAKVCFEGPEEELTRSDRAQPAIFVVSMIAWEALRERTGVEVTAVAGLSSGEWAALCAAGVVCFEDAIRILEVRGRVMQEACQQGEGGMLGVIGLEDDICAEIAKEAGIEVANYNSPGQVVLSGSQEGVAVAESIAKERGARRALPLPVAGAFHSSLMKPAADAFSEYLVNVTFSAPAIPVLSNVTGLPHEGVSDIREKMGEQITGSVQWVKNTRWLVENGYITLVECGPGKVLSGLVKRIDKTVSVHNVNDSGSLDTTAEALANQNG